MNYSKIRMNNRRQERRRKFHESLVNILYAPQPQNEMPEELLETTYEDDHITDELEEEKSSSASDNETQVDTGKLTRAQRKRLRKKRLKEAALNRRKIIGPELPSSIDTSNDHLQPEDGDAIVNNNQTQGVRQNAAEGMDSGIEQQLGETSSCTSQKNKCKQRRQSRKLAKERLNPLTMKDCDPPMCTHTNNEA